MPRLDPQLPVQMVKTYSIDAPVSSHWRPASCEEVSCVAREHGWITTLIDSGRLTSADQLTPEQRTAVLKRIGDQDEARAYYIRHLSGREFTEHVDESGVTVFDFQPGQTCFMAHKVRIDRPEIFIVRGGDWRGNPTKEHRIHARPEDWVEDFQEHQDVLATRIQRG